MTKTSLNRLILTQFIGAFNDHAWKIITFAIATKAVKGSRIGTENHAMLSMVIFLLPILLLGALAAPLADWISKRTVIVLSKIVEITLMATATLALYLFPSGLLIPYTLLALVGAKSALFTPAKYGIIPETVPEGELSWSNGKLEMWSILAVVIGTGIAPLIFSCSETNIWIAPATLTLLSCFSLIAAVQIPRVAAAGTSSSSLQALQAAWSTIRSEPPLYFSILGGALYWMIFSMIGQHLLIYTKPLVRELELYQWMRVLPFALFGLGLGSGALLCGRLSKGTIEYGFIPLGAIGFTIFSLLLGTVQPAIVGTVALLIPMGLSCGMIAVPLNTICQQHAPKSQRGTILTLSNIFNLTGMICGLLLATVISKSGVTIKGVLITSSLLSSVATVWTLKLLPTALYRVLLITLTRTFYKLRIVGNREIKGGALLVSNHLSMTDAFLITASIGRPIHFIVNEEFYHRPWIRPGLKLLGAIPISSNLQEAKITLEEAGKLIDEGKLVCICPEGQISHTEMMQDLQHGAELILKKRACPLIPIHLDNPWGSLSSFERGSFLKRVPHKLVWPVTLSIGESLSSTTPVHLIRRAIEDLETDAWMERHRDAEPIQNTLLRNSRRAPWKTALIDREKKVSRFKLLSIAFCLKYTFKKDWKEQNNVGIMLPPTIGAVATNIAAVLAGKTSVNLNYTTGLDQLTSAVEQAELKSIVTSKKFLSKVKISLPSNLKVIYLEDLNISKWTKILSGLSALFPQFNRTGPDDLLTLIFTSGSTGTPKGVMLSHFNVGSNVTAVSQLTPRGKKQTRLLHTLPLFHSFGYMSMWLGLNHNIPLVLHPDPLDGTTIGKLTAQHKVSLIFTTPTFLRVYMRRIPPQQLNSVNCILTGAEKLPIDVADNFAKQFGIQPIEGYGVTECSPVIAASTLSVRRKGIYQPGSKKGSVGQAIPGVFCKTVDPETYEEKEIGEEGLLLVRGTNVMQGYLDRQELTNEVLKNGWYTTGDIALIDTDGYIRITDRLSRFSKIGGEMVPHGKVEEALNALTNQSEPIFSVTAIPDPVKGERLAVLYTCTKEMMERVYEQLDLPKLFIPRMSDFISVKELPVLGSGKLDLKGIKAHAVNALS